MSTNPIDLNSASAEEIQTLRGFGRRTAAAIIENRPLRYHVTAYAADGVLELAQESAAPLHSSVAGAINAALSEGRVTLGHDALQALRSRVGQSMEDAAYAAAPAPILDDDRFAPEELDEQDGLADRVRLNEQDQGQARGRRLRNWRRRYRSARKLASGYDSEVMAEAVGEAALHAFSEKGADRAWIAEMLRDHELLRDVIRTAPTLSAKTVADVVAVVTTCSSDEDLSSYVDAADAAAQALVHRGFFPPNFVDAAVARSDLAEVVWNGTKEAAEAYSPASQSWRKNAQRDVFLPGQEELFPGESLGLERIPTRKRKQVSGGETTSKNRRQKRSIGA